MTLATRCPACGTVFRVVQDQLRVSEGWVRCGRCAEVFNAADRLVELPPPAPARPPAEPGPRDRALGAGPVERPAPPVVPVTVAEPPPVPAESVAPAVAPASAQAAAALNDAPQQQPAAREAAPPADEAPPASPTVPPPAGALQVEESRTETPPPAAAAPEEAVNDGGPVEAAAARSALPAEQQGPEPSAAASELPPLEPVAEPMAESLGKSVAEPAEAPATPSFLRQAERAQRWRRPGVRAALASLALAGLLGLIAQALIEYRDEAAARWASLRPLLERACDVAGCRIEAPRRIEDLVVDSSGLVRTEGTPLYRLSIVLRNRADTDVSAPAIDLTLTDVMGRVVSRKVLGAADLGAAAGAAVPAGGTLPLQVALQVAQGPVSGYTIELFYP